MPINVFAVRINKKELTSNQCCENGVVKTMRTCKIDIFFGHRDHPNLLDDVGALIKGSNADKIGCVTCHAIDQNNAVPAEKRYESGYRSNEFIYSVIEEDREYVDPFAGEDVFERSAREALKQEMRIAEQVVAPDLCQRPCCKEVTIKVVGSDDDGKAELKLAFGVNAITKTISCGAKTCEQRGGTQITQ